MLPRPFRSLTAFSLASAFVLGLAAQASAAGEKDKEALKLYQQAIDEDYLNTEYDKAAKKLNDAIKKCGKDGCTKEVLGKVYVGLGTVQGIGLGKLDLAKDSFAKALQADPKAALVADLTTPELTTAFEEAKKAGGGTTAVDPGKGGGEPGDEPGDKPGAKAGGDFDHTPPAEQAVNTPVPIYFEPPDDVEVGKVTVQYKPFGATKFKPLEMKAVGDGYGVELPCDEVTTTGDIKYYISVTDPSGSVVGSAGTRKQPYLVPIKNEIEGDAPALPGKTPPTKCAAKEDCPPGLPGCPDAKGAGGPRGDKGWGASCEESQECKSGLVCLNGSCEEGTDPGGDEKPSGKGKKNLLSLGVQIDLMLISGAENVCTGEDPSYPCFHEDGTQFYGSPGESAGTNGITGGLGLASIRVLLGFDRLLYKNLALGIRLGWAFGGPPSSDTGPPNTEGAYEPPAQAVSLLPLHAEGRASWFFGDNAFEKGKIRPFVFVGGGLGNASGSVPVKLCDRASRSGRYSNQAGYDEDGQPCEVEEYNLPRIQDGDPQLTSTGGVSRKVDAYQVSGLGFIGLGGGANYAITDSFGVALELKLMLMVPTFALVIAPTVGPVFAF